MRSADAGDGDGRVRAFRPAPAEWQHLPHGRYVVVAEDRRRRRKSDWQHVRLLAGERVELRLRLRQAFVVQFEGLHGMRRLAIRVVPGGPDVEVLRPRPGQDTIQRDDAWRLLPAGSYWLFDQQGRSRQITVDADTTVSWAERRRCSRKVLRHRRCHISAG